MLDTLIVGAGFSGCVLAERIAASGRDVLLIDRRSHIGGNAYDEYDEAGILIHRYGAHIFHTNSLEVFAYLSRFTDWRPYEHRVLTSVGGHLLPFPINLDTLNRFRGTAMTEDEAGDYLRSQSVPIGRVTTAAEAGLLKIGAELYDAFYRGYTRKQWGRDPEELNAQITNRIPVRTNRDDRYFEDVYQGIPTDGYTRMFWRMLDSPRIRVMLQTDYRKVWSDLSCRRLIYTGPVDEYFGYGYGRLPYRSLRFEFRTYNQPFIQDVAVVNYPNTYDFTRIAEFKHITGQENARTTVCYEYPEAEGDPYYPVPCPESRTLARQYADLARSVAPDVLFAGRLGTYRYYNMDQVTAQALALARTITGEGKVSY